MTLPSKETNPFQSLRKTDDGFIWDSGDAFLWEMLFDQSGSYVGQRQVNVIDDDPPVLFFCPETIDGVPYVNGVPVEPLTEEEMAGAIA